MWVSERHNGGVSLPAAAAPAVAAFDQAIAAEVPLVGLYAGGSLGSGDYVPGISDLDLVAIIAAPLDAAQRRRVGEVHGELMRSQPGAAKLHCVYVPAGEVETVTAPHVTWAGGRLIRRPLSGIGRGELLRFGITIRGPAPAEVIPPVDAAGLRDAARAELTGFWSRAAARRLTWLNTDFVDLGLITIARANATVTEGRLITKAEAIGRLGRYGVPDRLVGEIARRRAGETVPLPWPYRLRRARIVRELMLRGIASVAGGR
jgi:hypothetical protein